MNLTDEEKENIAFEVFNKMSISMLSTVTLLRITELAINMNSDNTKLECEAVIDGKKYNCKMKVTYEEVEE